MDNKQIIRQYCQQFKMGGIQAGLDQLIKEAEAHATGYLEFTARILQTEVGKHSTNHVFAGIFQSHFHFRLPFIRQQIPELTGFCCRHALQDIG